jgi:tetratricopeptide (TPR) repeat protein
MKIWASLLFSLALIAQDDAQELLRQGALLNQRGQFDKAAPLLERAVKAAPQSAAARMELAVCLARLHRYKRASEVLKPVSPPEAAPQLLLYRRLRASIASGNEEHAAAASEMELALDLAPADKDLLLATAVAEFRASLLDQALAHAQSAKSIQNSAPIENLIGDIQEKRGDSLAAVHSYQAAVELAPDNEQFRLALALELLRHHTSDAAILVLEQAIKRFPSSLKINVALALGYFLVNRDADATKVLLDAMRLDSGRDFVLQYLSELLITQGDTPDPAVVAEICADADAHPMSGRGQAVCGGLLLRVQIDRGDTSRHAELLQRLQKAVHLAPQDDTARCQLGKALALDQHWPEARKQMEECARLVPDSTEWHYQLARIYLRLGLRDLAKEQERLRTEADKKLAAESQKRYATLSKFLYALKP